MVFSFSREFASACFFVEAIPYASLPRCDNSLSIVKTVLAVACSSFCTKAAKAPNFVAISNSLR